MTQINTRLSETHQGYSLTKLVDKAAEGLLSQQPVHIIHAADYKRDGFPLPIKRIAPSADGTTMQEYRPLAILEYVQECLSGEAGKQKAADRAVGAEK